MRGVILMIVALQGASEVVAQQKADRSKIFQLIDLDGSDALDKEEFSGGAIGKMRRANDAEFDRKDLDDDGKLSVEEFVVAAKWSEEEYRELRRVDFARQDKNDDGELTIEQFVDGKGGIDRQYAEDMFVTLDKNKNNILNEDEFVNRENLWSYPRIQFQYRDANRDGKLTIDEYIANEKGKDWEADRRRMFEHFNADGDEVLSIDEFDRLETEAIREHRIRELPEDQQLLAKYDLNDDASVTLDEFQLAAANARKPIAFAKPLLEALDQDGDSILDRSEINRMHSEDPRIEFAIRDFDGDRLLTLAEQIGDSRGKPHEKWRRLHFQQRDFDQDRVLSLEEYSMAHNDRRVLFLTRDTDKNGKLTIVEQLAGQIGKPAEDWLRLNFRGHDLDRNRVVTRDEYLIDDKDVRIEFSRRDADGDRIVTLEEHVARNLGKDPQREEWDRRFFRGHDLNRNGELTLEEFGVSKDDIRVKFNEKDIDGDGLLDADEFLANAIGKDWEPYARRTFQLHDQDQNGNLSLNEFAATDEEAAEERRIRGLAPEERDFARLDKSNDSNLSFEEFVARHRGAAFVELQENQIFRTLDFDRNNRLDLNEFLTKNEPIPQVQFAFRDADGNGSLLFDEFVRFMPSHANEQQRLVFVDHDMDKSDSLSVDEFIQLESGRLGRERWAWLIELVRSPMNWVTALVVLFDMTLVFFVGRTIVRRMKGKQSQQPKANVGTGS